MVKLLSGPLHNWFDVLTNSRNTATLTTVIRKCFVISCHDLPDVSMFPAQKNGLVP